jgi:enolase
MLIKEVVPRIIHDSRGEETIEISIHTLKGIVRASAPSGKSKGKHEVPAYNERGIHWSLRLLRNFCPRYKGSLNFTEFKDLEDIEDEIKKFERDFGRLGGNVIYAFETALLKAAALERGLDLWEIISAGRGIKIPMPVGNCIGGGMHSGNHPKPDFQEFLLIPDEKSFSKAVIKNLHAYERIKKVLKRKERKLIMKRNDENAWQTSLSNDEVLQVISQVAGEFGLRIGIDAASSSFFNKVYEYKNRAMIRSREDQIEYIAALIRRYNIFYIEDGLHEDDFLGFAKLHSSVESSHLIVGDDLTVTNLERVKHANQLKSINAMIIKPNQCGSLLEVARVVDFCRQHKIKTIFSHRSGETMDSALADFAVGFGADFIKCGVYGKERLVKLGRIIQIEKSLGMS